MNLNRFRITLLFGAVAFGLSACASVDTGTAKEGAKPAPSTSSTTSASAPVTAAAAGATPAAPPVPGAPRPFAEIIKGAKSTEGLFPLWTRDDKTWIEIPAAMLDQPFFLSVSLARGIGERWLIGGLQGSQYAVGGEYVAQFTRAGGNIQLLARNTRFVARPGSPEERSVRNGFSDSLLSAAPLASAPHPERKSVLIEANALLLTDIPRGSHIIEREYRNAFNFDPRFSYIKSAKTNAERTVFDVTAHYNQPRIPLPAPPSPMPGAVPPPFFPPPNVIEDPRSLFLGYLYTFTRLPEQPMPKRLADSRIGHFTTSQVDFSSEAKQSPVRNYVNRWRLEKKEPAAAISAPVKPITFVLGNEIPERYRATIRASILEWNKAFEKVGFREAIVVQQQPNDSDIDTLETGVTSVRWQATATPTYGAIGPSQVDPRTGEILDADLGIDSNFARNARFGRAEEVGLPAMYDEHSGDVHIEPGAGTAHCAMRDLALRELGFTLALLEARGAIDPNGPEVDGFVDQFIGFVVMHEVGHTLGFTHNFRASTVLTPKQLADPKFTAGNALVGSVMDYPPANVALESEPQAQFYTSMLGPYDYWAVEYAYKPIAPEQETAELARIAARATEPQLAFATDADSVFGIDPSANIWDLSSDPLAFYRKRVRLTQELWRRLEKRQLASGESYAVLRRRFLSGLDQQSLALGQAAKFVGGAEIQNFAAGSSRLPITPAPLKQQREALTVITDGLFKTTSFRLPPDFLRKLASDRLQRQEQPFPAQAAMMELSLPDRVLAAQRDVLNRLMGPVVARRVLVNIDMNGTPGEALTLSELYGTLQLAIWDEARRGADADLLRRNLQREHLRRQVALLLGPSAAYPADARAVSRTNARQLQGWLVAAQSRPGLSAETRAHYTEAAETLSEALKAPLIRTGV